MFLIFLSMISRYIASYLKWSEEQNKKVFDITAFFFIFPFPFPTFPRFKNRRLFSIKVKAQWATAAVWLPKL